MGRAVIYTVNMRQKIAYIDASNLRFWVAQSGWMLDYKNFRSWLRDKFGVTKAILFMGLIPEYAHLYNYLQDIGYEIVFRPTLTSKDGKTKGNVDGELILQIVTDYYESRLEKAILVSWDGDYHCIVEFLKQRKLSITIVSPNRAYLSYLLKKTWVPIVMLDDFQNKLSQKTKKPSDMP